MGKIIVRTECFPNACVAGRLFTIVNRNRVYSLRQYQLDNRIWYTVCMLTNRSIPDDYLNPRRSAFFMAKLVLSDIREDDKC